VARLELVEYLRAERRFDNPAALVRQIKADIEESRHVFRREAAAPGCYSGTSLAVPVLSDDTTLAAGA
jgi:hypothetical protein